METLKDFEDIFTNIENINVRRSLLESDVTELMYRYYKEMNEVEVNAQSYFDEKPRNKGLLKKLINRKKDIHAKFWSNSDEFYVPCGLSSVVRYDWSKVTNIEVLQNYDSENRFAVCRMIYEDDTRTYLLKFVGTNISIEHSFES